MLVPVQIESVKILGSNLLLRLDLEGLNQGWSNLQRELKLQKLFLLQIKNWVLVKCSCLWHGMTTFVSHRHTKYKIHNTVFFILIENMLKSCILGHYSPLLKLFGHSWSPPLWIFMIVFPKKCNTLKMLKLKTWGPSNSLYFSSMAILPSNGKIWNLFEIFNKSCRCFILNLHHLMH